MNVDRNWSSTLSDVVIKEFVQTVGPSNKLNADQEALGFIQISLQINF